VRQPFAPRDGEAEGSNERRMFPRSERDVCGTSMDHCGLLTGVDIVEVLLVGFEIIRIHSVSFVCRCDP